MKSSPILWPSSCSNRYFVFSDAPEPTGEEGEDADVELPKVYVKRQLCSNRTFPVSV